MPAVNPPLPHFANAFDQDPVPAIPPHEQVPLLVFLHGVDEFGGRGGRMPEEQVKRHGPWEDVRNIRPYHNDAIAEQHRFRILGLLGTPDNGDWQGAQVSDAIDNYCIRHPEIG